MVEVYKTNVDNQHHASALLKILTAQFPEFKINFDLEDCDRILRVEGYPIPTDIVIELINCNGFNCEPLVY